MSVIHSIEINNFRGIKQLAISDFSNINLIVGDNNSGKTTILEAIQLLFTKPQLTAFKNVIDQRTILNSDNSSYTAFIKMFNVQLENNKMEFDIYASTDKGIVEVQLSGTEKSISGEDTLQASKLSSRQKVQDKMASFYIPDTVKMFTGSIVTRNGNTESEKKISCTSLDHGVTGPLANKEVYYVSSFGHLRYDLLQNIVGNPEYKKLAIDILKQFDNNIVDICYTKADDGTYLETIIMNNGINMPFSVYGDGMKKIIFILNRMFAAADSILMIDEIETGLHKKYFDSLFPIMFALADKLNVQLFIVTHNIESIDAILKYGNYDKNMSNIDPIRVITLKKLHSDNGSGSNIAVRNVPGKYVYDNRKAFEFEVRL